jgi:hypothetical protein
LPGLEIEDRGVNYIPRNRREFVEKIGAGDCLLGLEKVADLVFRPVDRVEKVAAALRGLAACIEPFLRGPLASVDLGRANGFLTPTAIGVDAPSADNEVLIAVRLPSGQRWSKHAVSEACESHVDLLMRRTGLVEALQLDPQRPEKLRRKGELVRRVPAH